MTPSEVGQWAALHRWAWEDPAVNAARGQRGLRAKFLREVDEHAASVGETPTEPERQRRTEILYRLHFQRMALDRERARRAQAGIAPSAQDGSAVA